MSMHTEQWTDRLSDYLDGELTDQEQRAVAAHVAECHECAATLADLQAIVQAAGALQPVEPATDLWAGIEQRIAVLPAARPAPVHGRYSLSLLQLVAASVMIALLSGWAALRVLSTPPADSMDAAPIASDGAALAAEAVPASFDDTEYDTAVADLEQALAQGRATLDPSTVTVLEDNLAIIDAALREARQALLEDPANGFLSGYLVEARQRKLDFLRRAAALTREMN